MVLTVQVGDIAAAVDVDVVVVSANTSLDFEGGGARALSAACGPSLAAELHEARSQGPIRAGDVVVTGAGVHPRLRHILWAVIRHYAGHTQVEHDAVVVERTLRCVWSEVTALSTRGRLRVAIVPLGAVELGAAASAALVARTLEEARLPPGHIEVVIVTNRAGDVAAMEKTVASSVKRDPLGPAPKPASAARPASVGSAPPLSATPPVPAAVLASVPVPAAQAPDAPAILTKRKVLGDAVIETFDRCSGVAPVGCMGVLFRIRRSDAAGRFSVKYQGVGVATDIAIDGIPVQTDVALRDGTHVFTCHVTSVTTPFSFAAGINGVQSIRPSESGVLVTLNRPPTGWRQVDFEPHDWMPLVRKQHLLALPDGFAATEGVWVRWTFIVGVLKK